jgi:hypothetical protein
LITKKKEKEKKNNIVSSTTLPMVRAFWMNSGYNVFGLLKNKEMM